jgi:hypothetical protein
VEGADNLAGAIDRDESVVDPPHGAEMRSAVIDRDAMLIQGAF